MKIDPTLEFEQGNWISSYDSLTKNVIGRYHKMQEQEVLKYFEKMESDYEKLDVLEKKNYLMPDYTISIPIEIANKLNWKVGSELVVNILDEQTSEIVIGKKFHGEEAKQKFRALREGLYDESSE